MKTKPCKQPNGEPSKPKELTFDKKEVHEELKRDRERRTVHVKQHVLP